MISADNTGILPSGSWQRATDDRTIDIISFQYWERAPFMPSGGSVTHWLNKYKAGDPAAAQELWERYYRRLIGLARRQVRGVRCRVADEEDVVQSSFNSFFQGAREGRFPQLADRDDLWQVLVLLTVRKAVDLVRHQRRKKRGGGAILDESALSGLSDTLTAGGLEQVLGREPTPIFVAQLVEECRQVLERLGSDELRDVAILKMEGYSNEEIRIRLGCGLRTVERRLRLIRSLWNQESPS